MVHRRSRRMRHSRFRSTTRPGRIQCFVRSRCSFGSLLGTALLAHEIIAWLRQKRGVPFYNPARRIMNSHANLRSPCKTILVDKTVTYAIPSIFLIWWAKSENCHSQTADAFAGASLLALGASHSRNFDHLFRPETLRTAIATAFLCPTSTTRRFPRVRPV